ncbi:drug/metabolite transporter (DMT)-like permease [Arcicella aurantiaca]|uniref:Drug/metabolite transporter (DMT)-like permease n=1 Tax=Arcicella aurantiaca TaxID=591202 RepID=A0A316E696_9BACT|nr:EamA family transporter [Arcicella aurantiaca]PWK26227.1 drug/metabolite transporter (DMT)-like permease [Arcicella aurantiaca]
MIKNLIAGILFAMLWASASAATKIGLLSAQPFVIGNFRFFIAGILMLTYAYIFQKNRLPKGSEWKQLTIYGILNVSIYLGCFVLAMKHVSAGIGSLSTATNPLFISILSAFWLSRPVKKTEILGLILGIIGVGTATYPLLKNSFADVEGLIILAISMLSYSVGTVYYSSQKWELPIVVINGWQVLLGGFILLPVTLFFTDWSANTFDLRFWGSVFWLVIPVSIGAVQLWLYLLKIDPVKASLWLFLCPIFGFIYASFILHEPITTYTYVGTLLVIAGLYLAQREKFKTSLK